MSTQLPVPSTPSTNNNTSSNTNNNQSSNTNNEQDSNTDQTTNNNNSNENQNSSNNNQNSSTNTNQNNSSTTKSNAALGVKIANYALAKQGYSLLLGCKWSYIISIVLDLFTGHIIKQA